MSCLVERNNNGEIISVLLPQSEVLEGAPTENNKIVSELFNNLVKNPLLTSEDSLEIYKNIFSNDFKKLENIFKLENGEPKLFYFTNNGLLTDSYAEALTDSNEGLIQLGFINTDDVLNTNDLNIASIANNDLVINGNKFLLNNTQAFISLARINSDGNTDTSLTSIQDVLFLENTSRKYNPDVIELRGHHQPQDVNYDLFKLLPKDILNLIYEFYFL